MAEALILKTVTPRVVHPFFLNRCPPKHRVFHQNPHFRNPLPHSSYIINTILNFVLQYTPPQ
ncbi:hypothetical protein BCR42DRAFT_406438 [Absidia repens]|uniref:Uncharacterized protein n=1 Tax=Absidia repens TaxID=90262 RepID=A0A1X2IUU3_9FUNG|nr:hypothetical protein BCR42DRAFT_406438 [Absidia repens]